VQILPPSTSFLPHIMADGFRQAAIVCPRGDSVCAKLDASRAGKATNVLRREDNTDATRS
jgi:hypothetical protein